jgi:predicted RNase H-like HicB family nuclease
VAEVENRSTAGPFIRKFSIQKELAMTIETEREEDGRWLAEVLEIAGALAYATTREQAINNAKAVALRAIAERLEHGEEVPDLVGVFSVAA